jgi:hypothetical protein
LAILPKAIYKFSAVPIKIIIVFFIEIDKGVLKFTRKHSQQPKQSCAKRIMLVVGVGLVVTVPNFKLYYRVKVTKSAWY